MSIHEEHKRVRDLLRRLGSSYVYQRDVIADDGRVYDPIKTVTAAPAPAVKNPSPVKKPSPAGPTSAPAADVPAGPSALAFALSAAARPPVAPVPAVPRAFDLPDSPPPSTPVQLAPVPAADLPFQVEPPSATPVATEAELLVDDLESRGHTVMQRNGKVVIGNPKTLTNEDRAAIKLHYDAVLALAAPYTEPSMVSFLGNDAPVSNRNYTPDEPPDLTCIDEIILNFATTGLDWLRGARPCGLTVSTLDGKLTRFLPFGFAGGNLDEPTIKRWAHEQLRGKKIYNARTKFDIHQARVWGVDLEEQGCTFSDIQHTAALLDDHRKMFRIDKLAEYYLPGESTRRVDESMHDKYHAADVAEREIYTAQLVGRLRDVMYPEIDKQGLRAVHDLEDAVIPAVVEMEKNGSPIDMPLLEQYARECSAARDALLWEINHECGFAFEHTASGWKRLLEKLGLSIPDSFAEDVLNEIDHPLVRKGQRASQYASLNSKIFKAYPEHIIDGVLYYNINQLASDDGGTVSGRFSIGLVQQVPNAGNHKAAFGDALFPRRLFIALLGKYLEADAAQIEFRLLVNYSQNARLLQAYRDDPWMSFHKSMQKMLLSYKPDMLYEHTKNYNFAAQYGAKSIKLATMMGFITEREGAEIRRAKAWDDPRLKTIHEIEAAYKQAHPEAGELLDRASHLAKAECDEYCRTNDKFHRERLPHRGFVRTLLGRRSRFPKNYKTYIGLNRILQGTGADIMKQKIVELHRVRAETGFKMRITNHDAVLGDAQQPETLERVRTLLNAQSFKLDVPILWECGTGPNWAEAKG